MQCICVTCLPHMHCWRSCGGSISGCDGCVFIWGYQYHDFLILLTPIKLLLPCTAALHAPIVTHWLRARGQRGCLGVPCHARPFTILTARLSLWQEHASAVQEGSRVLWDHRVLHQHARPVTLLTCDTAHAAGSGASVPRRQHLGPTSAGSPDIIATTW